jgi:hypothetical protein
MDGISLMEAGNADSGADDVRVNQPASWQINHEVLREGMEEPLAKQGCTAKLSSYYSEQLEFLEGLREVDALLSREGQDADDVKPEKNVNLAINLSNAANLILLASKIPLCIITGSLAILASVLDSLLDLAVGLLLFFARRAVQNENKYEYPIGKARMQPLGIVVFAAMMGTVSIQIMLQGLTDIISQKSEPALPPLRKGIELKSLLVIIVMVSNIVLKFFLWIYCQLFRNEIVRVRHAQVKSSACICLRGKWAATFAWDHKSASITV